jgi:hypothetical protein
MARALGHKACRVGSRYSSIAITKEVPAAAIGAPAPGGRHNPKKQARKVAAGRRVEAALATPIGGKALIYHI